MIKRSEVISFFDKCAETWDAECVRSDETINAILDNGGIRAGIDVLDVACGTGVLFPDYIKRGVGSVTGIDISPKMAQLAAEKFRQENVKVICGDVEETSFEKSFDAVMVYNAFPHFPEPERLIARLTGLLKDGGRLSIAHGMSREMLDKHHSGAAHSVSVRLMPENELKALLDRYLDVDVVVSNDHMYQVSGTKK